MHRISIQASVFLMVLFAMGCGGGAPSGAPLGTPSPVSGTVKLADGTPLRGGVIVFTPSVVDVGSKIRYPGEALVDEKGSYKAGLGGSGNGLVPGEYKVSIKGREIGELKNSNVNKVPATYKGDNTTLTVKVEEKDNVIDIVLK